MSNFSDLGTTDDSKNFFFGHPRGSILLFDTELWERFSFYGKRLLLVLFWVAALDILREQAYAIYGAYGAMYCGPLVIGVVFVALYVLRKSI